MIDDTIAEWGCILILAGAAVGACTADANPRPACPDHPPACAYPPDPAPWVPDGLSPDPTRMTP